MNYTLDTFIPSYLDLTNLQQSVELLPPFQHTRYIRTNM